MARNIKFYNFNKKLYIENEGWWFQWCCDCHLRHIFHFQIIRGKKPKDDYVIIRCERDDMATKLRKYYLRTKKKRK